LESFNRKEAVEAFKTTNLF